MPYIEAVEAPDQPPRIMGGTKVSLFTLDDDEYFEASEEEDIPFPYTYDTSGERVFLEHSDVDKLLDWLQLCVDKQVTADYLKSGRMPYINVEIFTHKDLFGISVNASSVGEETRNLAEKLIFGPEEEVEAEYEDDVEGIVIEQWRDAAPESTDDPTTEGISEESV